LFTFSSIPTWYASLDKPFFNPPNWIFSPVWTLLYFLMGISLYLILLNGWQDREAKRGIILFFAQLLLNVAWSFVFFFLHNPAIAFIIIILLWIMIFLSIFQFLKINKLASYLLIPYLLWVSFASILNFSIWQLN
jgi:tryptophan-rich sensory protein